MSRTMWWLLLPVLMSSWQLAVVGRNRVHQQRVSWGQGLAQPESNCAVGSCVMCAKYSPRCCPDFVPQGFSVQSYVTGEGPYANWSKHVADPFGYNLLTVLGAEERTPTL